MERTKRILIEWKQAREQKNYSVDNLYLNICYHLIKNNFVKIKEQEDIAFLYDNLVINNEILTKNNFQAYDIEKLKKYLNHTEKYITDRIFGKNKILLLNYYTNYYCGKINKEWELKDSKIWLDRNYNIFN